MKPPWKYLAQLLPRTRAFEADKASGSDSARKLVEMQPRPAATTLLSSAKTTPGAEDVDERPAEDLVTTRAAIDSEIDTAAALPPADSEAAKDEVTEEQELSNSDPLEQRPAGEAAVPLPRPRQSRLKTARKDRVGSTVEIPVTTIDAPVPATSSPVTPFFDKAKSLDEDIKQLKDLLAQKLRMQNAQLREMLERFERF